MFSPLDNEEMLDRIELGGFASPGIILSMSGHDFLPEWTKTKAKGQVGGTTTLEGFDLRNITITFYLCNDGVPADYASDDFAQWTVFSQLIKTLVTGPKPTTLPIYHPALAANGITDVTSGKIGGMVYDGKGGATVSIELLEYRPPKPKKVNSPSGGSSAKKNPDGTNKADPNAAAKAELDKLLKKAQEP